MANAKCSKECGVIACLGRSRWQLGGAQIFPGIVSPLRGSASKRGLGSVETSISSNLFSMMFNDVHDCLMIFNESHWPGKSGNASACNLNCEQACFILSPILLLSWALLRLWHWSSHCNDQRGAERPLWNAGDVHLKNISTSNRGFHKWGDPQMDGL